MTCLLKKVVDCSSYSISPVACPQSHWCIKLTRASCLPHLLSALRALVKLPWLLWVVEFKGCPTKPAPTQGAFGEQSAFSDCSLPAIDIRGGGEGIIFC